MVEYRYAMPWQSRREEPEPRLAEKCPPMPTDDEHAKLYECTSNHFGLSKEELSMQKVEYLFQGIVRSMRWTGIQAL